MSRFLPFSLDNLVAEGRARKILPTTDSGWNTYGTGREFLPAVTNLCPDPRGTLADGTFWPASTANTTITADLANPLPADGVPSKCLRLVNDGTADTPATANITVTASTSYRAQIYVYAPTLGGNLTISVENGHSFSLAALTALNTGWVRYSVACNTVGGEVTAHLNLAFAGGTASTVYVTGFKLAALAYVDPYHDGSLHDCAWIGTADASTSTRAASVLKYASFAATLGNCTFAMRLQPKYASSASPNYPYWVQLGNGNSEELLIRGLAAGGRFEYYSGGVIQIDKTPYTAGSTHVMVSRLSGTDMFFNANGTDGTPGTSTAVGNALNTLTIGSYAGGGYSGLAGIGPVIYSPQSKTDAWVTAIQANSGAVYSNCLALFRDFMVAGDYLLPLGNSSVAYKKVY